MQMLPFFFCRLFIQPLLPFYTSSFQQFVFFLGHAQKLDWRVRRFLSVCVQAYRSVVCVCGRRAPLSHHSSVPAALSVCRCFSQSLLHPTIPLFCPSSLSSSRLFVLHHCSLTLTDTPALSSQSGLYSLRLPLTKTQTVLDFIHNCGS